MTEAYCSVHKCPYIQGFRPEQLLCQFGGESYYPTGNPERTVVLGQEEKPKPEPSEIPRKQVLVLPTPGKTEGLSVKQLFARFNTCQDCGQSYHREPSSIPCRSEKHANKYDAHLIKKRTKRLEGKFDYT